jgi:hypothetical protein
MKKIDTPLVDEHLESLRAMQEVGTDAFFYTRLKARMEKRGEVAGWNFPLKPVWVLSSMALLFTINVFMLLQQFKTSHSQFRSSATVQSFAEQYDQTISSSY